MDKDFETFLKFLWGKLSFRATIKGLNRNLDHYRLLYLDKNKAMGKKNKDKNVDASYNVYGFTLALQVWTYEYKSNRKSTASDLHTALQGKIVKKMELYEDEKILYAGEDFEDMRATTLYDRCRLDQIMNELNELKTEMRTEINLIKEMLNQLQELFDILSATLREEQRRRIFNEEYMDVDVLVEKKKVNEEDLEDNEEDFKVNEEDNGEEYLEVNEEDLEKVNVLIEDLVNVLIEDLVNDDNIEEKKNEDVVEDDVLKIDNIKDVLVEKDNDGLVEKKKNNKNEDIDDGLVEKKDNDGLVEKKDNDGLVDKKDNDVLVVQAGVLVEEKKNEDIEVWSISSIWSISRWAYGEENNDGLVEEKKKEDIEHWSNLTDFVSFKDVNEKVEDVVNDKKMVQNKKVVQKKVDDDVFVEKIEKKEDNVYNKKVDNDLFVEKIEKKEESV
ncbi:uncharacterized protein LOC124943739 [Impatiens glandulifera]|uniref:uncharacterized protein LOC124943739 n=1 Tax=Impatiens glandulifera TaxID=253017 RepID=UPI001FB0CC20|nr:uncharacterized protein LOC124943739 [Impatiens glandulifera]